MDILTKKEVAALLRVSERSIDLWRERDGLPTVKIGQVCRFYREAVLRWFEQFQQKREVK
ncbi:MAG: helix-turn-helix domain-containing protein [Planctomycetia bacterium]|nr:helix-turn-helix domain-containing protein [Planctomycetia bacterium]